MDIFHDLFHKFLEFYVDDMVIKSNKEESLLDDLKKVFIRRRKYKRRLIQ